MGREITALTERLACVNEAAVLRSLDAMQTAGMTMPPTIEPRKIIAVYHYALSGVPASGLSAATQKLIRGDYAVNPNVLLGTIPSRRCWQRSPRRRRWVSGRILPANARWLRR
ncbi:hypothetical protein ACU4I5_13035 [Ensifer adhaerens]